MGDEGHSVLQCFIPAFKWKSYGKPRKREVGITELSNLVST